MVWMLLPVLCVFGQANTEEPLLLANEFAERASGRPRDGSTCATRPPGRR